MQAQTTHKTTVTAFPSAKISYDECMAIRVPFYCEENAWHILRLASEKGFPMDNLYAIFISNPNRCVAIQMQQAASEGSGGVCLWDYHVVPVIVSKADGGEPTAFVYDTDSTLPFPTSLANYLHCSISRTPSNGITFAQLYETGLCPEFRVVTFADMLRLFSSDRRHMISTKTESNGNSLPQYMSPPPQHPCISASNLRHSHSLPLFLKMSSTAEHDSFAVDDDLIKFQAPGVLLQHIPDVLEMLQAPHTSQ